ncbi:hypothetical protein [Streptomyces violascens]|uniref:Secreted protein n=1 Tax=Streptomyces violascens TaxID=67381 RepID=A0ABQ3QTJ4_9ACTN|nr:hypothetical protein [Streptomyces violascens]GHI40580.1 hypothetical protein Sviol_49880 [Streptomyces violascens]
MRRIATVVVSVAVLLALGAPAVSAASAPAMDNQDNNLLDTLLGSADPGEGPVAQTQDTLDGVATLHGLLG